MTLLGANNNNKKGLFLYIAMLVALLFIAVQIFSMGNNVKPEAYNVIIGYFEDYQVEEYSLDFGTGDLTLKLRDKAEPIHYDVPYITFFREDIKEHVDAYEVETGRQMTEILIQPEQESIWFALLPTLLMVGVMVFFWFSMMKQARGGGNPMSFGKAKTRTPDEKDKVTFEDVAGADEEKQELEEIVQFLKDPARFQKIGARIPKGVLLTGPPGTGKTLLAKAVAGEAGVPFYSISGSDFVEMFVGVGASRVRDLFEQAKKTAPSIVFIDEIDAVGRHRGAGLGGGHDEREQTLNQLLVEMDGFGANSGVIVVAATNRKDILDPALLRPGRFDRHVFVSYPDVKGREAILKVHTKNKPIGPDVDLKVIAQSTGGFTGADLENLVNEAALLAARHDKKAITMIDIQESTIKVIVGPEKRSHVVIQKERHLTAVHEAGHAIVTYNCPTQDKVHEVSVIPRGGAGGYTLSLPEKDVMYKTCKEMKEDICTLLGGRIAEELVLGDISTGASNDIQRVTHVATAMVTQYGFSKKLGTRVYGKAEGEVFLGMDINNSKSYSEETAFTIDSEINALIEEAYTKTTTILSENMDKLLVVTAFLEKHEKINGVTFTQYMSGEFTMDEIEARMEEEEKKAAELAKIAEEAREAANAKKLLEKDEKNSQDKDERLAYDRIKAERQGKPVPPKVEEAEIIIEDKSSPEAEIIIEEKLSPEAEIINEDKDEK